MAKKRLVLILGPTAVGKSRLALRLAADFNGEIINCDSMQVYRGFDIGTDKPGLEMRQQVPHHLLDIIDPHDQFNAATFVSFALKAIEEIISRHRLPFVVGGTGLYIKALIDGLFPGPGRDPQIRQQIEEEGRQYGFPHLHAKLMTIDPEYGRKIHPNDRIRIVRALEIYTLTGRPISEHFKKTQPYLKDFLIVKIGLKLDREELKSKIEERVERMFARGMVEEVKQLLAKGVNPKAPPFQALGYKQVLRYLRKEISLEEAIELTKKETKQYAKRQMTWFRQMSGITWFNPEEYEKIKMFLKEKLGN
ncbi:MAG: tRNA (adenosine(37)-N6)-dimethylallyltransferase MiaA [Candidatus Aminicenantes bacterium]|nr:tRNA (adenosine(37)-N6)-dimethylallyltransferase MiaA [Candidatus Aminicenantes bacterium]